MSGGLLPLRSAMRSRATEVVEAHDGDVAYANTQNGASSRVLTSQASQTMIEPGELTRSSTLSQVLAGLAGVTLGSDFSTDCVVWCGVVVLWCPSLSPIAPTSPLGVSCMYFCVDIR